MQPLVHQTEDTSASSKARLVWSLKVAWTADQRHDSNLAIDDFLPSILSNGRHSSSVTLGRDGPDGNDSTAAAGLFIRRFRSE